MVLLGLLTVFGGFRDVGRFAHHRLKLRPQQLDRFEFAADLGGRVSVRAAGRDGAYDVRRRRSRGLPAARDIIHLPAKVACLQGQQTESHDGAGDDVQEEEALLCCRLTRGRVLARRSGPLPIHVDVSVKRGGCARRIQEGQPRADVGGGREELSRHGEVDGCQHGVFARGRTGAGIYGGSDGRGDCPEGGGSGS